MSLRPIIPFLVVLMLGAWPAGAQDDAQGLDKLADAKVSLGQALKTAEQTAGGKAFSGTFESGQGEPFYKIRTIDGRTVRDVSVDAATGDAKLGATTPVDQFDLQKRAEIEAAGTAQVSSSDAVAAAERQANGKAKEIGVHQDEGHIGYRADIAKDGDIESVTVDPMTGRVH